MSYEKGSFKYAVIPDMEELERLMRTNAELLEALKRFVDVCDNGNPIDIFNALGSCVEPARQAIAKAEGK